MHRMVVIPREEDDGLDLEAVELRGRVLGCRFVGEVPYCHIELTLNLGPSDLFDTSIYQPCLDIPEQIHITLDENTSQIAFKTLGGKWALDSLVSVCAWLKKPLPLQALLDGEVKVDWGAVIGVAIYDFDDDDVVEEAKKDFK